MKVKTSESSEDEFVPFPTCVRLVAEEPSREDPTRGSLPGFCGSCQFQSTDPLELQSAAHLDLATGSNCMWCGDPKHGGA
jgi:hypothetical protein